MRLAFGINFFSQATNGIESGAEIDLAVKSTHLSFIVAQMSRVGDLVVLVSKRAILLHHSYWI